MEGKALLRGGLERRDSREKWRAGKGEEEDARGGTKLAGTKTPPSLPEALDGPPLALCLLSRFQRLALRKPDRSDIKPENWVGSAAQRVNSRLIP